MIRLLLFALLFAMPAVADNVFMDNTTSESNMCVIGITGQTTSNPAAVARATYSPITYTCAAGTYLPADGIECVACPGGKYCEGGQYTYNETTPQGITGDITAGYYSSGGASTATGSTCLSGYSCGQCWTDSATGRPAYTESAGGASSCSVCPAVTGELASRATGTYDYYSTKSNTNEIHDNGIIGCRTVFTDTDDTGDFTMFSTPGMRCFYGTTNNAYGSLCQITGLASCIAGYGSILTDQPEWNGTYANFFGVDTMNGRVCGACPAGTYSAAGDTTCTPCPAGTYTATTGQSSCTRCAAGTYQDETGQTSCKSCPAEATHRRTTFNTTTLNGNNKSVTITYDGTPTVTLVGLGSGGYRTSADDCWVNVFIQTSKGKIFELDGYNSATEEYDIFRGLHGWIGAEPGYYLTNKDTDFAAGGCTDYAYYAEVVSCPAGSYCPGVTQFGYMRCDPDPATNWPENRGLYTCPANNFCPANSSSATPCDTGYSSNAGASSCTPNTITIDWSGYGAGNNQTQSTQCTYGGSITTPTEAPTKRGHVFVGWTFDLN